MGMAASQGRFLQLTSRKNSIGLQLTRLSNQKVSLSREMQTVTQNYRDALNTKTLKWSDNGGVSYVDLSYSNLMSPSSMNKMSPYVLTDNTGRVVIASNYEDYAKMISPEGKAGGDYQSNRAQILSELTGVDASVINSISSYDTNIDSASDKLNGLTEPKKNFAHSSTQTLLEKASTTGITFNKTVSNWKEAYNSNATVALGSGTSAASTFEGIIDNLANSISKFFNVEDYGDKFAQAVKTIKDNYSSILQAGNAEYTAGPITGNSSGYTLHTKDIIQELWGAYKDNGGEIADSTTGNGDISVVWYDVESDDYTAWVTENEKYQNAKEAATSGYNSAVATRAGVLTANQESQIAFYDAIFTAIAENGWTQNDKVTDTDYLNEMLQNGYYSLTTMEKSLYVEDEFNGSRNFKYEYTTDIAVNNSHVYTVNDTDVQNEAIAEYEAEKSRINAKETRIDTRMTDLQTEQSAIQQMLQGIEQVEKDNIERTFSIFS